MQEETERLLPLIRAGKIADLEIQELTDRIRKRIKEDASTGKVLGELLSRIKQASKAKASHAAINWVPVAKGFLAIGHKPGGKISFEALKIEGTSAVLTLLNENEGAAAIGKQVQHINIAWIWFPFSASSPHEGERIEMVEHLYRNLSSKVDEGAKIYIHCSAGIHRTGMITYGFLRYLGLDKTAAFEKLQALRAVTAEQVGEHRLLWADRFYKSNS